MNKFNGGKLQSLFIEKKFFKKMGKFKEEYTQFFNKLF
jgi:hypothetical protein